LFTRLTPNVRVTTPKKKQKTERETQKVFFSKS